MIIWLVDTGMENSCAWSNKRDAIKYLKDEAKDCGWKLLGPIYTEGIDPEIDPTENEDYLLYTAQYKNNPSFTIMIEPIFLDEKPYFYP